MIYCFAVIMSIKFIKEQQIEDTFYWTINAFDDNIGKRVVYRLKSNYFISAHTKCGTSL